jgi:hypothetical protein
MDLQKARDGSLLAKYAAAIIMIVGTALMGCGVLDKITVWDVATCATFVAAFFGTVDLNLLLEKLTGGRKAVPPASTTMGVPG